MAQENREVDAYLARIRKTIAESNQMVEQMELRMAETDRLLASQGLTREQVMNFKFTPAQREAVNRELAKNGMEPLPADDDADGMLRAGDMQYPQASAADDDVSSRSQKFGMMMKQFVI